jgi:hypothetical protein
MNKSQINHRIAKICGWKPIQQWYISLDGGETALMYFDSKEQAVEKLSLAIPCEEHTDCPVPEIWCNESRVPNYYECLNSMREAEAILTSVQLEDYIALLFDACYEAVLATAPQRAQAFLKTFGKWEDGK